MPPTSQQGFAVLGLCALLGAPPAQARPQAAPVIPGLHQEHGLDQTQVGRLLIRELRCAACHGPLQIDEPPPIPAPDLSNVGARVDPAYLQRFIAAPGETQPGCCMPDVLANETPALRAVIAADLTHFLVSRSAGVFERGTATDGAVQQGRKLFHTVGCLACHEPRIPPADHETLPVGLARRASLDHVPDKYGLESLAEFLFHPALVRPSSRMPDMALTREEAHALAAFLLADSQSELQPFTPDVTRAARGEQHFLQLNCVGCHPLAGLQRPRGTRPLPPVLNATLGCLAPEAGRGPRYSLNAAQRASIGEALMGVQAEPPTPDARLAETLTTFNCIACHARDDYGGVEASLDPYFTTDEPHLGDHGRLPPRLTQAGAKLTREWIQQVLFDGASVRPYMGTRMPRFGQANLAHLPGLFETLDQLQPREFAPPEGEAKKELREAGRTLLGDQGLACITCHDFNSKPSPGYKGVDLITSPERLKFAWFEGFLISPQEYRPGIVMPESWPQGQAVHTGILEGDTRRQIEAIWFYLTLGRSAADPPGIRSRPSRLTVEDTTRTYRGRSSVAGFRGIAVGFPCGLSYAFDANHGALAGLWQGEFVSVRWDGQGAGEFNPASRPVELARDVAFYRLRDAQEPWPLAPHMDEENPVNPDPLYPKNRGYRFKGYYLDAEEVPTFMYTSGAVRIEDKSLAASEGEQQVLRRTLTFEAPEPEVLYLRALCGEVQALSPRVYRTPSLQLTLPDVEVLLRPSPAAEARDELLLKLDLPRGSSSISIDYEPLR